MSDGQKLVQRAIKLLNIIVTDLSSSFVEKFPEIENRSLGFLFTLEALDLLMTVGAAKRYSEITKIDTKIVVNELSKISRRMVSSFNDLELYLKRHDGSLRCYDIAYWVLCNVKNANPPMTYEKSKKIITAMGTHLDRTAQAVALVFNKQHIKRS